MRLFGTILFCWLTGWLSARVAMAEGGANHVPSEPKIIHLDFSASDDSRGGVLAADLNGDGKMDFVVTAPGHIGGYELDGTCLWHLREDVRVSAGLDCRC